MRKINRKLTGFVGTLYSFWFLVSAPGDMVDTFRSLLGPSESLNGLYGSAPGDMVDTFRSLLGPSESLNGLYGSVPEYDRYIQKSTGPV